MKRIVVYGFGYGLAVVLILFMAMMLPGIGRIAESLLTPGYLIPEAYWGAAHDPVQILMAFLLNVVFYSIVMTFGLLLRQKTIFRKVSKRL
jgi:hypothetical protein